MDGTGGPLTIKAIAGAAEAGQHVLRRGDEGP